MKKLQFFLFSTVLIFAMVFFNIGGLPAVSVHAATNTYYLSPDGDDSNPGTVDKPWKTLKGNAGKVQAGDTVYLRGGIYSGQTLEVKNSGTEGHYITYAAYQGETPVIADSLAWGVKIKNKQYIILDGITVKDTNGSWIEINKSSNIIIRNCSLSDGKLRVNGFVIYKSSFVTVQDCKINTLFNQSVQDMDLLRLEESDHCLLERLEMTQGPHGCINLWNSSYNVVRDCNLYNTWQKNIDIMGFIEGVEGRNVIEDNKIYMSRHAIAEGFEWKGGLGIQIGQPGTIVRRNLIYDNDFYGIILNAWSGDEYGPVRANGNHIYNNVFHKNGYQKNRTNSQSGMVISDWDSGKDIGGNVIKNNIFFDNRDVTFFIRPGLSSNLIEGNCLFNPEAADNTFWVNNSTEKSLSWFESNHSGNVRANINTDPLFKNAESADYTLQPESPCIDSGKSLTKAIGEGSGKALVVEDAAYFFDGYGIVEGDTIVVGSNQPVKITGIDYSTNTLSLETEISWKDQDTVNLPFKGTAPDMGVYDGSKAAEPVKQPIPEKSAGTKPPLNTAAITTIVLACSALFLVFVLRRKRK